MSTDCDAPRQYDLEDRALRFAGNVARFIRTLPKSIASFEYAKQVIRSSASIGANYIEANEAIGEKDRLMRMKICRKEARETIYWLNLIQIACEGSLTEETERLRKEAQELRLIFSSIINKLTPKL